MNRESGLNQPQSSASSLRAAIMSRTIPLFILLMGLSFILAVVPKAKESAFYPPKFVSPRFIMTKNKHGAKKPFAAYRKPPVAYEEAYEGPRRPVYGPKPQAEKCIVLDLHLTTPHGPRYGHPAGRPSYSTSAAIPDYSEFNRPSQDVPSHSGYASYDGAEGPRPMHEHECPPKYDEHVDCHRFLKYRSFEGICNNLKYPTWGNRTQPYSRITARTHADGKDIPRIFSVVTENGEKYPLPNAQVLSVALSQNKPIPHPVANSLMPFSLRSSPMI